MDGPQLIDRIRIRGLLSYSPKAESISLESLNVIIGPNGSGKSNLISALSVLQAAPQDVSSPFRGEGPEWIWKGQPSTETGQVVAHALLDGEPFLHEMTFTVVGPKLRLAGERIELPSCSGEYGVFLLHAGQAYLLPSDTHLDPLEDPGVAGVEPIRGWDPSRSVLAQIRDPEAHAELTGLGRVLSTILLYRGWTLGLTNSARRYQPADLPGDFLLEDGSNLALVFNEMEYSGNARDSILTNMRKLYPQLTDITTRVIGGSVLLFFHEENLATPVPSARVSDGILRFLALLTILCHPSPPPLICIEEPELGLHPDMMPLLGDLLIDAATRTQLIVTTHSDGLVSALSDVPEAVLVCERDGEGTHLRRLERGKLERWLEKYQLGDLWLSGEIGGTTT